MANIMHNIIILCSLFDLGFLLDTYSDPLR
jgi:hypothetical protein